MGSSGASSGASMGAREEELGSGIGVSEKRMHDSAVLRPLPIDNLEVRRCADESRRSSGESLAGEDPHPRPRPLPLLLSGDRSFSMVTKSNPINIHVVHAMLLTLSSIYQLTVVNTQATQQILHFKYSNLISKLTMEENCAKISVKLIIRNQTNKYL
ncbi:hypothetical protein L1049_002466 [Liquidambar formosana]|uniref:Uncharacterized protein n=1 Tax=Liquidambar formosana TaxID=63359 RepID=A0AAP0R6Q4_LIQFO